jgi:hypothetical protein
LYGSRGNLRKVGSGRSLSSAGYGTNKSAKDFNHAYRKLVDKMYTEGGATGLVTEDEVRKLHHYHQLNKEEFQQR